METNSAVGSVNKAIYLDTHRIPTGRKAIAEATRQRMASGQQERVLAGFYRWLEGDGRQILSRLAKNREKRKRWKRMMLESTHASPTGA